MSARLPAALVLIVAATATAPARQAAQSQPVFRSSVELLAVDVAVLDKDGRPVSGLGPSDFEVEVGGKPRAVERAEFIDFSERASALPDLLDVTSNQTETAAVEPRLVLLLVDDQSFSAGEGRAVFLELAGLVDRLFPRDPLAFATLSGMGQAVEFTTDRQPIADALRKTIGRRSTRPPLVSLGISEAIDMVRGSNLFAGEKVMERECADEDDRMRMACERMVEGEAASIVSELEQISSQTTAALARHFEALAALPGTKYVLLVSQGVVFTEQTGVQSRIAQAAAAAGVTLHALFVDRGAMPDVSQRFAPPTAFEDSRLRTDGLETVAGSARGTVHRMIGDPTNAFERIRREMAAVYRLGIALEPDDEGPRPIEVKVRRPGVRTRAHRQIIAPSQQKALTLEQRLARTLQTPLVDRGLPIRLATFAFRGADGTGQIVVSAEADADADGLRAAYALRDQQGVAIAVSELARETIIAEQGAPPLVVFSTSAPIGEYLLKLAVVDREGRTGSVSRPVSLRAPGEGMEFGDLIVLPENTEVSRVRPSSRIAQRSKNASVYFELYAGRVKPAGPVSVAVEIAEAPEGPALVSRRANVPIKGDTGRFVSGRIPFSAAALPPGRYFARLTVEGTDIKALRGFTVTAGTASMAAAALLPDEARAMLPRFRVGQFLSGPMMEAIARSLSAYADSNIGVQDVVRGLEDGTWHDAAPATTGDPVTDATLRGLHALAQGQPADAEEAFREALEADPEFTLALALAGGAWASVGRDREATRSWRTSLATGIDAPFLYKDVMTALLRTGDVKGSREFFDEIAGTEGAETLGRELAIAAAISGDRRAAAAALGAWVDAHPEDADAAFLLVLALYELRTIEKDAAAREPFESRAKEYIARNAPRSALVARWMK